MKHPGNRKCIGLPSENKIRNSKSENRNFCAPRPNLKRARLCGNAPSAPLHLRISNFEFRIFLSPDADRDIQDIPGPGRKR
jgi:hypothetical protein